MAPIASDGTFRLELSPTIRNVRLSLQSEFLRLSGPSVISVPRSAPVELVAEVGASLVAGFQAPPLHPLHEPLPASIRVRAGSRGHWVEQDAALVGVRYEATFHGLRADAPVTLRARSGVWPDLRSPSVTLRPFESRRLEYQLPLGARIEGRVVDVNGYGVEGVDIELRGRSAKKGASPWRSMDTVSRADGSFELHGVPDGWSLRLLVQTKEYLSKDMTLPALKEGELRGDLLLVLERGGTVSGVVHDATGRPYPNAIVVLQQPRSEGQRPLIRTRTADDGSFAFGGLGPGPYGLRAEARRARQRFTSLAEGLSPGAAAVVLKLQPGFDIRGRVALDGELYWSPLRVVASPLDDRGGLLRNRRSNVINGRFELEGLTPGAWTIKLQGNRQVTSDPLHVTLPGVTSDGSREIQFDLQRRASTHGD